MTIQTKNHSTGGAGGPLECQSLTGVDVQEINQSRPTLQANLLRKPRPPCQREQDAFSIPEFCRRNGFGPGLYFKIAREGGGPRVMRVGRRTLISREAAEEWRREREAASAPRIAESV